MPVSGSRAGSKRIQDSVDDSQLPPRRRSSPVVWASQVASDNADAVTMERRIAENMAELEQKFVHERAQSRESHAAQLRQHEHNLSVANRVHDQLRQEVHEAAICINAEKAKTAEAQSRAASAHNNMQQECANLRARLQTQERESREHTQQAVNRRSRSPSCATRPRYHVWNPVHSKSIHAR